MITLPGAVLGLAWNGEGSLLAVGWVGRDGSRVDVFTPWRGVLRAVETIPVERVVDVLAGEVTPPALGPFADHWRWSRRELLPEPSGDGRADPPPMVDGILVADAQARFARFTGGVGVGVDAARRTFVEGAQLPAADTGTGEDDARLYGRPQLRTALRLPNRRFVVGGYSQFGHESLVVDIERKATRLVADSDREADDRLLVDVRQTELLSGERWASGELLRARRGAFRRSSVLRVFDGEQPRWAREWQGILTAFVATPDGALVVADEGGALTVVAAANGEPRSSQRLARPARWLAMLDDETVLLHDGVELATFTWPALEPSARVPLPAGAPVVAAALAPGRVLALGRGARAFVYRIGR